MVREKLSTFKDVLRVLTESFKGVSGKFMRVFQGSFKSVSRYLEVSRMFQGSFKGVNRKFQGCFKEV